MRAMRKVWIISVNSFVMILISSSFVRVWEVRSISGARWTSGLTAHQFGPVICLGVPALGIILELFNSRLAMDG
jgi:hypothetical protein